MRENNIRVELLDISVISRRAIVYLLKHSNNGFKDFLKDREYITEELEIKFNLLEHLTFDQSVEYLLRNPEMVKTPIVFDKEKILYVFMKKYLTNLLMLIIEIENIHKKSSELNSFELFLSITD